MGRECCEAASRKRGFKQCVAWLSTNVRKECRSLSRGWRNVGTAPCALPSSHQTTLAWTSGIQQFSVAGSTRSAVCSDVFMARLPSKRERPFTRRGDTCTWSARTERCVRRDQYPEARSDYALESCSGGAYLRRSLVRLIDVPDRSGAMRGQQRLCSCSTAFWSALGGDSRHLSASVYFFCAFFRLRPGWTTTCTG